MREIKLPTPSEIPLEPVMVDGGFQLNVLLPHRERVPRGWHQLIEGLEQGQNMTEDGLRLWVRAKHLERLQHVLARALTFPWGAEISSHFIVRYFVQTAFFALEPHHLAKKAEPEVDLVLTKTMGFAPTPELIEESKRLGKARVEAERALDEAVFQRKRKTGKIPTEGDIHYFKTNGDWPEALPSAPERPALPE
jgi:hypothetical protein